MTRYELQLPALRSDNPLGFLAALGVLNLTTALLDHPPRLSWHGPAAPAVLHTHTPVTHTTLADLLTTQLPPKANKSEPEPEPLPQAPGLLSIKRSDGGPLDGLRMPIRDALARLRTYADAERIETTATARWFTALVNQLATESPSQDGAAKTKRTDAPRYTRTTPLFGRSGQMTLAGTWTDSIKAIQGNPGQILTALTGWQRVEGFTSANLDPNDLGDAHMVTTAKPARQGVPGATWLALHGLLTTRLTGDGRRDQTTSWYNTAGETGLIWPAWQPALTTTATTVLLEHPLLRTTRPDPTKLRNLGVTAIYTSTRARTSKGFGPLQQSKTIYP